MNTWCNQKQNLRRSHLCTISFTCNAICRLIIPRWIALINHWLIPAFINENLTGCGRTRSVLPRAPAQCTCACCVRACLRVQSAGLIRGLPVCYCGMCNLQQTKEQMQQGNHDQERKADVIKCVSYLSWLSLIIRQVAGSSWEPV